jgi:hypothetical protein
VASQVEDLRLRELDQAGISLSWRSADLSAHCQSNRFQVGRAVFWLLMDINKTSPRLQIIKHWLFSIEEKVGGVSI